MSKSPKAQPTTDELRAEALADAARRADSSTKEASATNGEGSDHHDDGVDLVEGDPVSDGAVTDETTDSTIASDQVDDAETGETPDSSDAVPVDTTQEVETVHETETDDQDDSVAKAEGSVTADEGSVTADEGSVTEAEGSVTADEGSVTADEGSVTDAAASDSDSSAAGQADEDEPDAASLDETDPGRSGISNTQVAVAVGVLTLIAFALRIADVGARPLHHDESLDAWWSWKVREGTFEGYDPVYHGPLRFYITAAFYWFFGETVAVARLFSVLTGTLLVATPYFIRRQLGQVGTIAAALLLCISPSLLYYSRFGREDIQIVFLTAVMLVGTIAYFRQPNAWLPSVVAAALAASLAIKESTYLLIYVVVAFFFLAIAVEYSRLATKDGDEAQRDDRYDTIIPFAAVIGLFVTLVVAHSSGATFAMLTGYLVILAALAVYFGAGALQKGYSLTDSPTVARMGAVGWIPWALAAGIFVFLFELWFTFFFTQPENWTAGLTDAIRYWQSQQEVNRGSQPWYYYMIVMPAYEWLGMAFAFVGFVVALRRRTFALALIAWLAIASFMIYSYAGERMPWLVIHPLYPTLLLAALGIDYTWRKRNSVGAKVGLGFLVFGLAATAFASLRFAFVTGADSREILVQGSQGTPHVTATVAYLTELDHLTRQELGRPLSVGVSSGNSWPWGFYLRDFEGITWITPPDLPEIDVLIPDMNTNGTALNLEDYPNYTARPLSLRSWWVPRWITVTNGDEVENDVGGYFDGGVSGWARWLYDREIWDDTGCGSLDQYFMVSNEIQALVDRAQGYGALEPLELEPIICASPMFRETS